MIPHQEAFVFFTTAAAAATAAAASVSQITERSGVLHSLQHCAQRHADGAISGAYWPQRGQ
jgi:hypothetical protein